MKMGRDGALYYLLGGATGNGVRRVFVTPAAPSVTSSDFRFNGVLLPGAPHRLVYQFNTNVFNSLSTADLTLVNNTTSTTVPSGNIALSYDFTNNTATFTFPGYASGILPDGSYTATLAGAGVSNMNGQPLAGDDVENFFFLNGDANRDRRVNLDDFNILAANFGQSGRDFTQGDFTYNGVVNLDDFNILASRFGQVVAPAASVARAPVFGAATKIGASDTAGDALDDLLA
jgi:hypothetical protein